MTNKKPRNFLLCEVFCFGSVQLCGQGLEARASPVLPNARTSGGVSQ